MTTIVSSGTYVSSPSKFLKAGSDSQNGILTASEGKEYNFPAPALSAPPQAEATEEPEAASEAGAVKEAGAANAAPEAQTVKTVRPISVFGRYEALKSLTLFTHHAPTSESKTISQKYIVTPINPTLQSIAKGYKGAINVGLHTVTPETTMPSDPVPAEFLIDEKGALTGTAGACTFNGSAFPSSSGEGNDKPMNAFDVKISVAKGAAPVACPLDGENFTGVLIPETGDVPMHIMMTSAGTNAAGVLFLEVKKPQSENSPSPSDSAGDDDEIGNSGSDTADDEEKGKETDVKDEEEKKVGDAEEPKAGDTEGAKAGAAAGADEGAKAGAAAGADEGAKAGAAAGADEGAKAGADAGANAGANEAANTDPKTAGTDASNQAPGRETDSNPKA